MRDTYDEIYRKLVEFANKCEKISAMVLFGSRARTENRADDYSDYDIIFFVSDVNYFIETDEWLRSISEYYISFVERTAVQDYERRVFFHDAMDMDFIFYHVKDVKEITAHEIIQSWYAKGFEIVVDKINYQKIVEETKPCLIEENNVSEQEYDNLVQTFWFHSIWATKKLLRGEIWSAKNCIDGYMKTLLREMLEHQIKAIKGNTFDVWHDGRFFDEWAGKEIGLELNTAFGMYDQSTLVTALEQTMKLFAKEAKKTAKLMEYHYPIQVEEYAVGQVKRLIKKYK